MHLEVCWTDLTQCMWPGWVPMHGTVESMPRACESVYAKYLCKAFLLSLFPMSKIYCLMCWHAVSLNASGIMGQNNFNNSFFFKHIWQKGPKQMCLSLLKTLYKSIWKHSHYILKDKSKSTHHMSLCDYSGELEETWSRGGSARFQGNLQPWITDILPEAEESCFSGFPLCVHRPCCSVHCGGPRATVAVEGVCAAPGPEWLRPGADRAGAPAPARRPVWNAPPVETADGPCGHSGAHQPCSQPDGAQWLQWRCSRSFAKPELSSTLQPPQPSLIYFCFSCLWILRGDHSSLSFPVSPHLCNTCQLVLLETAAGYAGERLRFAS